MSHFEKSPPCPMAPDKAYAMLKAIAEQHSDPAQFQDMMGYLVAVVIANGFSVASGMLRVTALVCGLPGERAAGNEIPVGIALGRNGERVGMIANRPLSPKECADIVLAAHAEEQAEIAALQRQFDATSTKDEGKKP